MTRDPSYGDDTEDAGRFVPLYVLVNGRTSPRNSMLDLATQVIALPAATRVAEPEYEAIISRCWTWISVAEIAAQLELPLAVTKLLVDVLIERQYLSVGMSAEESVVDRDVLEMILARLETL